MVANEDKTLLYTTKPFALVSVPKAGNVKTIHFIVDGKEAKL
jgi:hypothetical protein